MSLEVVGDAHATACPFVRTVSATSEAGGA
jgi:hypothetical protein